MPAGTTSISKAILNSVFQVLYNQTGSNPAVRMTRHELQTQLPNYPATTILGCLITYEGDHLISCTKNDILFTPKDLNNDFEEFHITSTGAKKDTPYM